MVTASEVPRAIVGPIDSLERTIDELTVIVHPGPEALARAAADEAAIVLREAVTSNGSANAMFATGNSQLAFVDTLVRTPDIPWSRVVVFHMDEYLGVGPENPAGFRKWIHDHIVERVRPGEAHYLDGLAAPDVECARYGDLLRRHPLDLCCLGIGENGHLAFNDPPVADFDDPLDVKVVDLDRQCRLQQVHEGHFPTVEDVPTQAMTVTIPALLRARRVVAVVPEARKARPVHRALTGPVSTECPASQLRRQQHATVHLDPDSAGLLGWS